MWRFRESLLLVARHRCSNFRFPERNRSLFSSLADDASVDGLGNQVVLVEGSGCSRTAVLHRPESLNALNTAMGVRLHNLYKSWEDDPDIGLVMMKWQGIFCRTLYTFMYFVGTYLKPHVAFLNGITMGGGAGVSIPGTYRVATDKTVFATPETLIGYHPDAGASFHLSHLPGHIGEYLALSGEKLNGPEVIACGLATHYALSEKLPMLEEQLGKSVTGDPPVIESLLENYRDVVCPHNASVIHRTELLDRMFGLSSVEEIIDALESEVGRTGDEWCKSTLSRLKESSPLSLKVSLRSIREGRFQTFGQCLIREYHMSLQAFSGQISRDFCEGVRARLVDRDFAPMVDCLIPQTFEELPQFTFYRSYIALKFNREVQKPLDPEGSQHATSVCLRRLVQLPQPLVSFGCSGTHRA